MKTHRNALLLVPFLAALLGLGTVAKAATGTVTLRVKPAYIKFTIDGSKWEDHFFYKEGLELVIQNVATDKTVTLKLSADGYKSQTLVLKQKGWRKKYDRKTKAYTLHRKGKVFLKKGSDSKAPPKKK